MRAIRACDTRPELMLRKALRARGLLGYRCSPRIVPGRPDVAFTRWQVAVFVDGCFWHGCPECYVRPEANRDYWDEKLRNNQSRDGRVTQQLRDDGWLVLRVWEHEVRGDLDVAVAWVEAALEKAGRKP